MIKGPNTAVEPQPVVASCENADIEDRTFLSEGHMRLKGTWLHRGYTAVP